MELVKTVSKEEIKAAAEVGVDWAESYLRKVYGMTVNEQSLFMHSLMVMSEILLANKLGNEIHFGQLNRDQRMARHVAHMNELLDTELHNLKMAYD